tara:strand:- start:987 stop:1241 length:255 start_codon:yes stop_codon:yes gene_type:complete
MTRVELPKWFNGHVYDEGDTVTNPFSGQSYELTAEELSIYDFVIGANNLMEMGLLNNNKVLTDMRRGLDWFRKNNPEAYYVLLD